MRRAVRAADGPEYRASARGGGSPWRLGALIVALAACGEREPARIRFEAVPASSGLRFRHELPGGKLDTLPKSAMGGFGVLDLDGDGRNDVFCVNGGWHEKYAGCERPPKTAHHRLFRNTGDAKGLRFEDVTDRAGVGFDGFGMGVCVGDVDGDGRPDLYVSQYGASLLLRNRGDGTFEDVATKAGLAPGFAAGAAFLDYDRDGDLDLFVGQYVDPDQIAMGGHGGGMGDMFPGPGAYVAQSSRLYRNRGDGTFEDVSAAAGITRPGKAMGVVATDLDGDGWIDLFVANDAMANFAWKNRGDGTFTEAGPTIGLAFGRDSADRASMGITLADLDGDGRRDALVPDTQGGAVYWARQKWFTERSVEWGFTGLSLGLVGWGDAALDADCDGWTDVYLVHGDLRTLALSPCFLVRNVNGTKFESVMPGAGGPDAVANLDGTGRAAVAADLDGDGLEDLLVNSLNDTLRVYRNTTERAGHWVRLNLRGRAPNPLAIGATVRGRAGKRMLVGEVASSTGYLCCGDLRVHFGLGEAETLEDVVVRWPDGTEQRFGALAAGKEHVLERK